MKVGIRPCRPAISFTAVLNSAARSAAAQGVVHRDRGFVDARPGLGVQAFERNAECRQLVEQLRAPVRAFADARRTL